MKGKFNFVPDANGYSVYAPNGRFLGFVGKDPLRQVWTNNHEPRTYPTRLAAAKGLRLL